MAESCAWTGNCEATVNKVPSNTQRKETMPMLDTHTIDARRCQGIDPSGSLPVKQLNARHSPPDTSAAILYKNHYSDSLPAPFALLQRPCPSVRLRNTLRPECRGSPDYLLRRPPWLQERPPLADFGLSRFLR